MLTMTLPAPPAGLEEHLLFLLFLLLEVCGFLPAVLELFQVFLIIVATFLSNFSALLVIGRWPILASVKIT